MAAYYSNANWSSLWSWKGDIYAVSSPKNIHAQPFQGKTHKVLTGTSTTTTKQLFNGMCTVEVMRMPQMEENVAETFNLRVMWYQLVLFEATMSDRTGKYFS